MRILYSGGATSILSINFASHLVLWEELGHEKYSKLLSLEKVEKPHYAALSNYLLILVTVVNFFSTNESTRHYASFIVLFACSSFVV